MNNATSSSLRADLVDDNALLTEDHNSHQDELKQVLNGLQSTLKEMNATLEKFRNQNAAFFAKNRVYFDATLAEERAEREKITSENAQMLRSLCRRPVLSNGQEALVLPGEWSTTD